MFKFPTKNTISTLILFYGERDARFIWIVLNNVHSYVWRSDIVAQHHFLSECFSMNSHVRFGLSDKLDHFHGLSMCFSIISSVMFGFFEISDHYNPQSFVFMFFNEFDCKIWISRDSYPMAVLDGFQCIPKWCFC